MTLTLASWAEGQGPLPAWGGHLLPNPYQRENLYPGSLSRSPALLGPSQQVGQRTEPPPLTWGRRKYQTVNPKKKRRKERRGKKKRGKKKKV